MRTAPNGRPIIRRVVLLFTALAMVAAACGDDSTATTQAPAVATTAAPTTTTEAPPEPVDLSFRLDFFTFNGYHNAAHVADEMGWFADEGITIEIREGQGSTATAQAVAEGETEFGMVVGTTIIDSVFQGLEIKSVAQHLVFSGFCVITVPSVSGVTEVSQLAGGTIANPPYGASGPLLPGYFAKQGLDDIRIVNIGETAAGPALLEGLTDAWVSTLFGFPILFKEEFDTDSLCFPFSDVDADPVGWGIVANNEMIDENPDVVRRFLRAFLKGWLYTLENPLESSEITFARVPTTTEPATGVASLQFILDFGLAPFPRDGLAFAEHSQTDWENSIQLAKDFLGVDPSPALEDLYTNEFLPTAEEIASGG
jgi:NitT/TauT family transport system substrate-binding protein